MFNLKKIGPATFLIPKEGGMLVDGLIIATEELLQDVEMQKPIEQVMNVAHLPGILGYSIAMPDIHWGYGFPIGGVAATDCECGVISPGGVGYDINCGVRLSLLPLAFKEVSEEMRAKVFHEINRAVPSGVGYGHKGEKGLSEEDYQEITDKGAKWSVELGFGFDEDLNHIESNGFIEGGDLSLVSSHAKDRGRLQMGTLGSGNHFIEIGEVEDIILKDISEKWQIQKGQMYVLIHTGSRGFGHQICQDTLNHFVKKGYAENLPDKQLVAAPLQSQDGMNYFKAMAVAANFAFNNRQQILHAVREAFFRVLQVKKEEIRLLYDVCHNIAKFETHEIQGKKRNVCVHRKGATRAFGPNAEELTPLFRSTGQPVIVPGDMGRASYLLVGEGNPITFCSSCHGAGRARSRTESMKIWKGKDLKGYMRERGVEVAAASFATVAEEMPDAYKDVGKVVEAVELAHLAKIVAKLKPHYVIKG